jgi:hypothetical protein
MSEEVLTSTDDARRARELAKAETIRYASDAQVELARINLSVHPFPPIPKELWHVLEVLIPGDPETDVGHENTISLPMTDLVWASFGNVATPNFSSVEVQDLTGTDLLHVWTYAIAYLTYLREQSSYWRAHSRSLVDRQKYLRSSLVLHYGNVVDDRGKPLTSKIREAMVQQDPALLEINIQTGKAEAVAHYMVSHVKSLEAFTDLCSRMLTHLHAEFKHLHGGARKLILGGRGRG